VTDNLPNIPAPPPVTKTTYAVYYYVAPGLTFHPLIERIHHLGDAHRLAQALVDQRLVTACRVEGLSQKGSYLYPIVNRAEGETHAT